ncbi:MAG: hypothetical protein HZB55_07240 [Deltaproteobacteria bacterium]|nr:hypothetical protein [Deltaproteobacteria bacterium]
MRAAVPTAFGAGELEALAQATERAREMIGQYFALPDRWFEWTSHEVCTLRDLRQAEILGEGRLAQIRRLHRVLEEGAGRILRCEVVCPHYRICLQDHNILGRLRCRADLSSVDLLTWVLSHEYVHLVRFQRLDTPYHAAGEAAAVEEARVSDIVRGILSRLGPPSLRRASGDAPVAC